MYAVFQDGARQFRVSEGEHVKVDHREAEPGSTLEFPNVLLLQGNAGVTIGSPYIPGAKIVGEIVEHPSDKFVIRKYRRRKNYRRKTGHKQTYTTVKVSQIVFPS
jgi:large subunit ribosomal protein L21